MTTLKIGSILLAFTVAIAGTACGGDDTGSGGSSGGGGGGNTESVNGCSADTAEDHTGDASLTIQVGAAGLTYSPACAKIAAGTTVHFDGNFAVHPTLGGTVDGNTPKADSSSPIQLMDGDPGDVDFPNAGTFPYFCNIHGGAGMMGAIFVE